MIFSTLSTTIRLSLRFNSIFTSKFLIKSKFYSSISTNLIHNSNKCLNHNVSLYISSNKTTNYQLYYQTRDILNRLNYKGFDKFQSDIFSWVKSRCNNQEYYLNHKSHNFSINSDGFYKPNQSNVILVVGDSNTGKTSSYLLALTDVVNDPSKEGFRINRDNYRSKNMMYGNLKGSKMFVIKKFRKIRGIPKFNWDSYVVPLAIVLVPFRELGLNIFDLCSKIDLRSRLLAGGKGYKKQTGLLGGSVGIVNKNQKDNVDVIISTPEMLLRTLNGEFEDLKIEMRFVKFLVFEESDLLSEPMYLEKINQILNMIYSSNLNLMYLSRFKTDSIINNIQQLQSISDSGGNSDDLLDFRTKDKEDNNKIVNNNNNNKSNDVEIIEKETSSIGDDIKKIFIHTSNNDKLEVLIDVIDEISYNPVSNNKSNNSANFKDKTVIYCKNTKCNKFIRYSLLDRGINITNLFGDMNYEERTDNLIKFQNNSDILVSTNFSTRFKLPCKINNVILFDFPHNIEEYVHYISTFSPISNNSRMYLFFNNKNVNLIKEIQSLSKSYDKFEFRNLSPKLSKKLYLNQKMLMKQHIKNDIKVGKKKLKLTSRKNLLSPKNKKIMKKFYLKTKAIKKVEFLRKRGILKKGMGLPKMPDKNLEKSDSQEFIRMQRSPDGFLQIIPKRRSRIKTHEDIHSYDKESIIIPGTPTYQSEPLDQKKHHRNTHF